MSSDRAMKKVLVVARAFPPFQSPGHSMRAVKFIKYLPALGWLPSVLTIDDGEEYEFDRKLGSASLLSELPDQVLIHRTAAGEPTLRFLQKEREFGERAWLPGVIVKVLGGMRRWIIRNILLPDRCVVWLPFALRRGRRIVGSEGIDVIFATCPPHSSALIGAVLKLLTGKPLVLDFRDDWIDTPWYDAKPGLIRMIHRRLEGWVVKTADRVILVTEWSRNAFIRRYPTQPIDKFVFISNGYDLADFAVVNAQPVPRSTAFTVVHAGAMTDADSWMRNPAGLFQAVQTLLREVPALSERLTIVFAGGLPEGQRLLADNMGLSGVIMETRYLPHDKALRVMKSADLLLAINYGDWSTIIPAKIYEYWAIGGPPILLLSCPGAAVNFVRQHNLGFTVDPSDADGIYRVILSVYRQSTTAAPLRISTNGMELYDRKALTRRLAQILSMTA